MSDLGLVSRPLRQLHDLEVVTHVDVVSVEGGEEDELILSVVARVVDDVGQGDPEDMRDEAELKQQQDMN